MIEKGAENKQYRNILNGLIATEDGDLENEIGLPLARAKAPKSRPAHRRRSLAD